MKTLITVLGATGSIGVSTLDVVARHPDRYAVFALTAHRQVDKLYEQCLVHRPAYAVVERAEDASALQSRLDAAECRCDVLHGPAALCDVASAPEVDAVMAAIVGAAGLLIPVRNRSGEIIAIKVRRDSGCEGPKYVYLSSAKYGGASSGAPVHVSILPSIERTTCRVTEGELKADIATVLSGTLTVSLPGATNWKPVLPILKALKTTKVILAFDSDVNTNPHVARALVRLYRAIKDAGYTQEIETWK